MKALKKALQMWNVTIPHFHCQADDDVAEIFLYDVIGSDFFSQGISAKQFANEWVAIRQRSKIIVRINSPGGDVYEGMAIRSLLMEERDKLEVRVDGLAGSIASVIALSSDTVYISDGGAFFVHDPWAVAIGTANELRTVADNLDTVTEQIVEIYHQYTGVARRDWRKMMEEETLIGPDRAVELGLAKPMPESVRAEKAAYVNEWKIVLSKLREGLAT